MGAFLGALVGGFILLPFAGGFFWLVSSFIRYNENRTLYICFLVVAIPLLIVGLVQAIASPGPASIGFLIGELGSVAGAYYLRKGELPGFLVSAQDRLRELHQQDAARSIPSPIAGYRFNPPPGWPPFPDGWRPPAGWKPDRNWPAAPAGWQFWVPPDRGW